MGFSLNSINVESVSPEKAAEFLEANYTRNRRIRPMWVEYLAREMREGRFMSTAEIHIMYRNGEPVMINGQHTCRAIILYGKPVRVTVRKTVTQEVGQIAMTYAFGHDAGIQRTFSDGMNAYGLSDQLGLPSEQINVMTSAIRYIKGNSQGRSNPFRSSTIRDTPGQIVSYVYLFAPAMKMLNANITPCEKHLLKKLRRRSSLSVALITFHYQPDKAAVFWSQIANPDGLAWNDPRAAARKYIEATIYSRSIEDAKLSRQIAKCWRAFCENEKLSQVNIPSTAAPLAILGTQYSGRQDRDFLPPLDAEWLPGSDMSSQ